MNTNLRQQINADWLPTLAWIRQGNGWTTNVTFAPAMVTTLPDIFSMELRLYDRSRALGPFHSKTVQFPKILRLNLAEVLGELNAPACDGIAEVIVRGEGEWSSDRRIKCVFDVWMEIKSDDGKFRVVGPTGQFAGSNRVRLLSKYAYESYPGVPIGRPFSTDMLLINPYTIPMWYQVIAYNRLGKKQISAKQMIQNNGYELISLEALLPEVTGLAAPDLFVSLEIMSRFKLVSYCLFRNAETQETTALDHTWPFLELRRD